MHWLFFKPYVERGGPLWIFGTTLHTLNRVFEHCRSFSIYNVDITAFNCFDCAAFSKEHIALWVEHDANNEPVIVRVDSLASDKMGNRPRLAPVYQIDKQLQLKPTGLKPGCVRYAKGESDKLTLFGRTLDKALFQRE